MLFGFLLMIAGLVYVEATKPQPISWFPSYDKADKIPLGTFVAHTLIADAFGTDFEETSLPPFEFLKEKDIVGSYLFVNDEITFDKTEMDSLFNWVSIGNTLFISANYIGEKMLDTLNITMATEVNISSIESEPLVKLVNSTLSSEKTFRIKKNVPIRYFSKIDTLSQTVLGISGVYENKNEIQNPLINSLTIPMKKGTIILHSQPEVFSNFFLLDGDNSDYTSALLSYLNNDKTLYWDNYYKSGKHINLSPLRVLLNNKYFKWAYYFVLIGVLLFILFEGKRKQRSIPIVKPLTNKTYEYTQTIAGMYLERNEYHAIAQKQIVLFLEYIRTKLRLPTEVLNERFYKSVAERSGNSIEKTVALFNLLEKINTQTDTKKEELTKLYEGIQDFKRNKQKI